MRIKWKLIYRLIRYKSSREYKYCKIWLYLQWLYFERFCSRIKWTFKSIASSFRLVFAVDWGYYRQGRDSLGYFLKLVPFNIWYCLTSWRKSWIWKKSCF